MDVLKYDSELGRSLTANLFYRSLRPLIVSLAPGQARTLGQLKVMREELASELATSINEFGPKMYEDFDQVGFQGGAPRCLEFDGRALVEDPRAICQRTTFDR